MIKFINTKIFFVLLALLMSFQISFAGTDYSSYSWDKEPTFEVPTIEEGASEIVLKDKFSKEYIIQDNGFYQFNLHHRITYISSELGVESNNKIYLTTEPYDVVVFQKARVITSEGEIIEFDEKDIKDGVDEESGFEFKYYALDGLDIGSFVERITYIKKIADYRGEKLTLQSTKDKQDVTFEVIAPNHLEFAFLSTNGMAEMVLDTIKEDRDEDKNYWSVHFDELTGLEDEPISYLRSNLQSVIYKLDRNLVSGNEMSSYSEIVQNYYNYMYEGLEKGDMKAINGLFKEASISDNMKPLEKVAKLEDHLKNNYAVLEYVQPEFENIKALLKNHASSENTYVKLYANALKELDIDHALVLTSDRTSNKFDSEFEAQCFLHKAFIYLPKLDKYIDPASPDLRIGYLPWEFMETYGLFIEPITIGGLTTAVGDIKHIKPLDHLATQYNHNISVDMTKDPYEPFIEFEVEMSWLHVFIPTNWV